MWHLRLRDLKMAPTVTFLSHWSVGICCFLSDHWKGAKVQLYSFPFLCPLLQSVSYLQTELCRNNLWDNSVCLRVHTGSIKRCSFRKLPSVTVVSSSEGKQPVRNFVTERMSMLENSDPPYLLHHVRKTSGTCYQEACRKTASVL